MVKRIAWISAAAVMAVLLTLIIVFCSIKVKDGFNTGATPVAVQISKNGRYSETGQIKPGTDKYLQSGEEFDKVVNSYYSMTSFIAMRGIVEGKGVPKAKLAEVVTAKDIRDLRAEPTAVKEDEKDKDKNKDKGNNPNKYLLRFVFAVDAPQNTELRVMKGTKDKPNVIKLCDENGKEKEYEAGDKVSFTFNEIVLVIEYNRFISDLTLYAFERDENEGLKKPEFVAYKIIVQANRTNLFNACTSILP